MTMINAAALKSAEWRRQSIFNGHCRNSTSAAIIKIMVAAIHKFCINIRRQS
ncbi:hypothetical protein [Paenibacillus chitinolyticus]